MMKRLEKYLEVKKLVSNVAKSEVVFLGINSSRKKARIIWKGRREGIEEVKEFTHS